MALTGAALIGAVLAAARTGGWELLAVLHLDEGRALVIGVGVMLAGLDLIRCGLTRRPVDLTSVATLGWTAIFLVFVLFANL
ncbi:hypothetical protein [Nonomuraea sp. NPDC052265]|uniref:hypothetical protein n=1 Tax=Nonomuraea sp. NPDC052265 TaxID=3364374 RepID=UPI0037C927DA